MIPWSPEPDWFAGETVAILAGGPSMSQDVATVLRASHIPCVAINTSFQLAPWADVIFAADMAWWNVYREALLLPGLKVCSQETANDARLHIFLPRDKGAGRNSALHAAYMLSEAGAARILLFGVDLDDDDLTHWHGGDHPEPLRPIRVGDFKPAREAWGRFAELDKRPDVLNCSQRSALRCFPCATLAEALETA